MVLMDAFSPSYVSLSRERSAELDCTEDEKTDVLATIRKAIEYQPRDRKRRLELLYLNALKRFNRRSELLSELVSYDNDERWGENADFALFRADVYAEVEGKLFDA